MLPLCSCCCCTDDYHLFLPLIGIRLARPEHIYILHCSWTDYCVITTTWAAETLRGVLREESRGGEGFSWLSSSGLNWALMREECSYLSVTHRKFYIVRIQTHNHRHNPFNWLLPCVSLQHNNYTNLSTRAYVGLLFFFFLSTFPLLDLHTPFFLFKLVSLKHISLIWSKCAHIYIKELIGNARVRLFPGELLILTGEPVRHAVKIPALRPNVAAMRV